MWTGAGVFFGNSLDLRRRVDIPPFALGTPFTLSAWIRLEQAPRISERLVEFHGTSPTTGDFFFDNLAWYFCPPGGLDSDETRNLANIPCDAPAGKTAMGLALAVGSSWVVRLRMFTGTNAIPVDGSWHHVALVVTESNITTYLDGQARAHNKTGTSLAGRAASIPSTTRPFHRLGSGSSFNLLDTRDMSLSGP
eukprot:tig00000241_g21040.t1